MSTPVPSAAEMQKLFGELTKVILFLDDEGYVFTVDALMEIRDGFRTLEKEHHAMREALQKSFDTLVIIQSQITCEWNKNQNPECPHCRAISVTSVLAKALSSLSIS